MQAVAYYMSLNNKDKIICQSTVTGQKEPQAKIAAALKILIHIYTAKKKWLELVDEVCNQVMEKRKERGAGEKPVLMVYDPNFIREEPKLQEKQINFNQGKP